MILLDAVLCILRKTRTKLRLEAPIDLTLTKFELFLFFFVSTAHKFVETYMDCLNSSEPDVVFTAAEFLPEFIVLDNG